MLVAGAAGFVGSTFTEIVVRAGHEVLILDALTYAGHRENLAHIQGPGVFELVVGDIGDGPLVRNLVKSFQPDAILNFAAESHVDRSIDAPSTFIDTNIRGTFTLLNTALDYWKSLDQARAEKFRFLEVSTDEVFGSLGEGGYFSETTRFAPNSPYSASKASADLLVRAWHHTYGLPTLITHCSNNYGPRQFPEKLIPHMIFCALNDQPLPVYGNGTHVRDWIHVEDHSRGILLALEKGVPGESYCFGGRSERNNLKVVQTICRELDTVRPRSDGKQHELSIQFVIDRPGHDQRYAIDDSRAERELGFRRKYDFQTGLRSTIRWYLDHLDWCKAVVGEEKLQRIGLAGGV